MILAESFAGPGLPKNTIPETALIPILPPKSHCPSFLSMLVVLQNLK